MKRYTRKFSFVLLNLQFVIYFEDGHVSLSFANIAIFIVEHCD